MYNKIYVISTNHLSYYHDPNILEFLFCRNCKLDIIEVQIRTIVKFMYEGVRKVNG